MRIETYIVNAFSEEIAQGNQAGVVLTDVKLPDQAMHQIAFDIGKPETAFVHKQGSAYAIRWFSPLKEMPLCGHATLAAAKVLSQTCDARELLFRYGAGEIAVSVDDTGNIGMCFPVDRYDEISYHPLLEDFFRLGEKDCQACIRGRRTGKVAVIFKKDVPMGDIRPDFYRMKSHTDFGCNGIGISRQSDRYDFETRYFNPWAGVDEDYVTGSIHTVLASYWSRVLGKDELTGYQASTRPGVIRLKMADEEKVLIEGKARIVLSGTFLI